jgi:membrane-bound lytic murein transglycosylase B
MSLLQHGLIAALLVWMAAPALRAPAQDAVLAGQPFEAWLSDLVAEARTRGFEDDLLEQTVADLQPLQRVIRSDRTQAEVLVTFERYMQSRVTPAMIRQGRELAAAHRRVLGEVERTYEVPGRFVLAIWGIETRYGRVMGDTPVFQALATLAWEPRRSAFFRGELFDALTMAARGYIEPDSMKGSWAGAMGHAQFMPSSYLKYAVDFDGDGRRDIWRSTPDALASVANYLKGHGWQGGWTWGREVRVPASAREAVAGGAPSRTEGCGAMRTMTERLPLARWQELGVRRLNGRALPTAAIDAALVNVGERSFLVYPNYDALLRYNCAHNYALTVAALADRLQ